MSDITDMEGANKALDRWKEKLNNNICPHCDGAIQELKKMGRSVYAVPCYHRLYQGRLPTLPPKLHPYLQEQLDKEKGE